MTLRHCLAVLFATAVLALPAASCGPDFPEAIFVKQFGPDAPYRAFTAGRLGVIRSTYRVRHLAIAYNILTGRALSAAEQTAAEAANTTLLNDSSLGVPSSAPASGYSDWSKARAAFGPVDSTALPPPPVLTRSVPGSPYQDFVNCLDDGFATAARTLAARSASYGARSPEVTEWVRGQDRVFANCGDLPGSFANGQYRPATPPPTSLPAPLRNAPSWLAEDRAYQTAAAHFYAVEFDPALAGFKTVAADRASPWSAVANYLTARTLIRQATLAEAKAEQAADNTPATRTKALADERAALRRAQSMLQAMRSETRMAPLQHGIDGLLGWLALRLDPEAQRLALAARLHGTGDANFGQDLIDLTYATVHDDADAQAKAGPAEGNAAATDPVTEVRKLAANARPEVDMLAWLNVVAGKDKEAASANWQTTHATVWLLASLMTAAPGDAEAARLIQAAGAISPSDPAWVAVTYHRLRLLPRNAATRAKLLAVTSQIDTLQGRSAANLYAALNASTAPDLNAWLATAGRLPAAATDEGGESDLVNGPPGTAAKPIDQPCGPALPEAQTALFTPPAAEALNTRLPLAVLATVAESSALSPPLRFAVAQAAWTRAVLLDQPAVARRLSPVLIGCQAAWKPLLSAYDVATTPRARQVAGWFALMRFASTEPNVRAGEPRPDGFATYSNLRDNWWAETVAPPRDLAALNFTGSVLATEKAPAPADGPPDEADRANAAMASNPLSFLSASERNTAQTEIAALRAIPAASDYFASEVLAWWHSHPDDPANAELLGQAMRVARNAPRTDRTTANQHALFDALHTAYPNSTWARRYTTWE